MKKTHVRCDLCMGRMLEPRRECSFEFERPESCSRLDDSTEITIVFQDYTKHICALCLARAVHAWACEIMMVEP